MNFEDPAVVAKAMRESQRIARERAAVVTSVMQVRAGREFFYNILSQLGAFRTPYREGDSHATAFNCGMQNAGIMVLATVIEAAPDHYMTMLKENSDGGNPNPGGSSSDTEPEPEPN